MSQPNVLHKRLVHQGHVIALSVEAVRLPSGQTLTLDIVRHPGAAAVVAVEPDAQGVLQVILVQQYRHPTGELLFELPAGKRDIPETPLSCAQRELAEETGYHAAQWTSLGAIWASPGFCSEQVHLFLATQLTQQAQHLDAGEELTVHRLPLHSAVEQARQGSLSDAKTVCGLLRSLAHLQLPTGFT